MKIVPVFLFSVFFFSCVEKNNGPVDIKSVSDSGKTVAVNNDTVAVTKTDTIPYVLRQWEKYWKSQHTDFSLKNFQKGDFRGFKLDKNGYVNDWTFLDDTARYAHSPDGEFIIYQENGGFGGDAESVAYLIKVKGKNKTQYMIGDIGSEGIWEDAGWLDNSRFVLTSKWRDTDKNLFGLCYTVYNLSTKKEVTYSFKKYYHYDQDKW